MLCKPLFQITFLQQKIQLLHIPDVEEETVEGKEHHRTRMANHQYVHLLVRKMISYVSVEVKEQDHESDPDGSLPHG